MSPRARTGLALATLAAGTLAAAPAHAAWPAPATWVSVGVLSGTTGFGAGLADYQWDVSPRMAWGAQALAGAGPWSAGLRLWNAASTQAIGLGSVDEAAVAVTSLELVGRARVARVLGSELALTGSGGWVRLGWDPDQLEVPVGGGSPPLTVSLDPVDTWIAGGGAALSRPLAGAWSAGLSLEARMFAVETAHRSADTIENANELFGDWSARFEIARRWDLR